MKEIDIDSGFLTGEHQKQSNTIKISRKRARKPSVFEGAQVEQENSPLARHEGRFSV